MQHASKNWSGRFHGGRLEAGIGRSGGGKGREDPDHAEPDDDVTGAGWATPLAADLGLLAVALCAYLAATYLMVETEGIAPLQADFRRRALGAAAVSGCLALLGLVLARWQTPVLWHSLAGRGLPLMVLALLNGPIALVAVLRERPRIARLAVAGQMVFVLWAWAVGQWPYLVPPDFSVVTSAAPDITLRGLLLTVTAGMVLVLPSLWWLFHVFKGRNPAGNPVGP